MNDVVGFGHFSYRQRLKKDFKVDDRVRTHSMPSDPSTNNITGTIVGKSADDGQCAFYIVLLDKPHATTGYKAITMIESCLDYETIELKAQRIE